MPTEEQRAAHAEDETAIRPVVADFGDAWNRHDVAAVVAVFADDLEHVSVRGRWQRGRAELERTHTQYHATIWKDVTYHPAVEHVHFLRPDVAVVIVHGTFRAGAATEAARSTWVMSKEDGRWLCRAFQQTNLGDVPIAPQQP